MTAVFPTRENNLFTLRINLELPHSKNNLMLLAFTLARIVLPSAENKYSEDDDSFDNFMLEYMFLSGRLGGVELNEICEYRIC